MSAPTIDPNTAAPAGIDPDQVRFVLAAAMSWFYDIAQPPGSIITHHGVMVAADVLGGNRRLSVVPAGVNGLPVLVVDVADVQYDDTYQQVLNPLGAGELEWWSMVVDDVGIGWGTWVAQSWNWTSPADEPIWTGSIALSRHSSRSLTDAVVRYSQGCSDHPNQPGEPGRRGVFCRCGWYETGNDLIVRPHWPARPESTI